MPNVELLQPGLQALFTYTVTESDTALAVGSGDVPVLATPRVLALLERATVTALDGHLHPGVTTVGVRAELDHLTATPVGAQVRVSAVLDAVDGRRLAFTTELRDGDRVAAAARIDRMAVDRERFLGRLAHPGGGTEGNPGGTT